MYRLLFRPPSGYVQLSFNLVLCIHYQQNINVCRNQYWSRKTWAIIDESLDAKCRQFWQLRNSIRIQSYKVPHAFVSFTTRSSATFTQGISEKNSLMLSTREGGKYYFEICQSISFFLTRHDFRRNYIIRA